MSSLLNILETLYIMKCLKISIKSKFMMERPRFIHILVTAENEFHREV